jgi:hypothetical protein
VVLKLDPGGPGGEPFDFSDTLAVPAMRSTDHLLALAKASRGALDTLATLSRDLAARLRDGPGSAASVRRDTALVRRMRAVSENARALSEALVAETSLPARVAADSIGPAVAEMIGTLSELRGEDRADQVADAVVDLAGRLERISAGLDRLDRDLRAGRGTAGRALYDDEIERQQEAFRARLDSLRTELRRKPWRWLRFKLF